MKTNIMNKKQLLIPTLVASLTVASQAAVIVGVSLDETTYPDGAPNTSGNVASNIPWTSDLAQTASNSLTFTGASGFITGGNSDASTLGINRNIETAGAWSTSFTITPNIDLDLADLTVVTRAISGGGSNQGQAHSFRITGTLDGGIYSATSLGDVASLEAGGAGATSSILNAASGSILSAGTAYTISFTANYDVPGGTGLDGNRSGNNLGLDSITLNGTAVPEPSSSALLGLGGLALLLHRRK